MASIFSSAHYDQYDQYERMRRQLEKQQDFMEKQHYKEEIARFQNAYNPGGQAPLNLTAPPPNDVPDNKLLLIINKETK